VVLPPQVLSADCEARFAGRGVACSKMSFAQDATACTLRDDSPGTVYAGIAPVPGGAQALVFF